jgi:hypothetical protein
MTASTQNGVIVRNKRNRMKADKLEHNSKADKIVRKVKEFAKAGKCDRCPPHHGENLRKRPKSDKYKTSRKGR